MKLYDMKMAPNPRRVRMFLAEKGISLPTEEVDIAAGANLKPAYLAINPRGVVPTLLLDDGSILDESIAICRYIEGLHPEPNLFGATPIEAARIESWQRRMEFDGLANVASVFRNANPAFADRGMPGALPPTPQIPALAERGMVLARAFMDSLDARLAESPFVAGDRFTVADITAFIAIEFARWVKLRPGPGHAALARWHEAMRARPSAAA